MAELPLGNSHEWNPYGIAIPTAQGDLTRFLENQAENLRRQHSLLALGDSDLPWQMLADMSVHPIATPGAQARFKHPDYGLIRATYVMFASAASGILPGAPVGWMASNARFQWYATTDFLQSLSPYAAGIQGGYSVPDAGEYGWMITQGINLQSVAFNGGRPSIGDKLKWDASGSLAPCGLGEFIIATLMYDGDIVELDSTHCILAPASLRVGF